MEQGPPAEILSRAHLMVLPGDVRPRTGKAWLVDWQGTTAVLRQLPAGGALTPAAREADVMWLHAFLSRLADFGYPAPTPQPAFNGQSWTIADGELWEVVSFLPGHVAGWSDQPPLEEIGALLGRYHESVTKIGATSQRPGALPLRQVPVILMSPQLEAAGINQDRCAEIRGHAEQLSRNLIAARELARPHVVIHGDFTAHNVIASGTPPRATGVIDFALAHVESRLADIGYALWRSGRPYQEAAHVDLARCSQFLRGYASAAPVTVAEARVIPVYLHGRGLQMIAKRVLSGRAETGMLAEVQWLGANTDAIGDAFAAAVT